jgi:hypothetical protein
LHGGFDAEKDEAEPGRLESTGLIYYSCHGTIPLFCPFLVKQGHHFPLFQHRPQNRNEIRVHYNPVPDPDERRNFFVSRLTKFRQGQTNCLHFLHRFAASPKSMSGEVIGMKMQNLERLIMACSGWGWNCQ